MRRPLLLGQVGKRKSGAFLVLLARNGVGFMDGIPYAGGFFLRFGRTVTFPNEFIPHFLVTFGHSLITYLSIPLSEFL